LAIYENELEEIKTFYQNLEKKPVLQVGYNRRFAPLVQEMKKVVGNLPMSINYRVNAGVIPKDVWVQDPEVGGGRILGEACHFIDTCTFLTGSLPESVFASCVTKADQSIPDEDNVSIVIKYKNGSTAVINYYAFGNGQLSKEYIELFAPDIALKMDNFRELEIFKGSKSDKSKNSNQDKGFKGEFIALKTAVEQGRLAISFEELYSTSKVTFAILESLKTGELQKL
jgi:predicted dehydrogenase